ncbi:MAG: sugar phosphate nucleotidyltransferase [Candidatus Kryptoniota bacterium]
MNLSSFSTIILAAGKGKRMKNPDLPKVMYQVNGKPMIDHVVELAIALGSQDIIAVVGFKKEIVIDHITATFGNRVKFAIQLEQLGTGHAVMQAKPLIEDHNKDVLVLSGDVPLLTRRTMAELIIYHRNTDAVMTVLTAYIDNPTGYGRMIRMPDGAVDRIVEEKDATPEEKNIREINSGIYVFKARPLFEALEHIDRNNAQNEYYLTDVLQYFTHHGRRVSALKAQHFDEIRGVNTVEQLAEAENALKVNSHVFREG